MGIIYRKNKLFSVNEDLLPKELRTSEYKSDLLVAVFYEFRGANSSEKYKRLSNQEKMEEINEFAQKHVKKAHKKFKK